MPVRTTRRKTVLALGGAAATALAAASLAIAQVGGGPPQFDGTPPAFPPPPAPNLKVTNCGPSVNSIVRTQNLPSLTSSTTFVPLPGAATQVVVPDGQSRCVKVLFTAETACTGYAGPDFCYVQALADGMPMDPDGTGFQAIDSEDDTASAHAYQWVTRLGEGAHVIRLERRVGNANTISSYDDWTFDTQVYL